MTSAKKPLLRSEQVKRGRYLSMVRNRQSRATKRLRDREGIISIMANGVAEAMPGCPPDEIFAGFLLSKVESAGWKFCRMRKK